MPVRDNASATMVTIIPHDNADIFIRSSIAFGCRLPKYTKFSLTLNRTMSTNVKILENSKTLLKDIFMAGVNVVSPKVLIRNKITFKDGVLHVADQSFEVKNNIYLVGFGKAVMGMALILEHILGDSLKKGIISAPSVSKGGIWESQDLTTFPKLASGVIKYCEGSLNNQPDDRSWNTTHEIIDLVEPLTEADTLIVLISGGGSALLYMPRPIIDPDDKTQLCKSLQNAGADIKELNTVRRKLSMVKGGGLARMAYPASVISLILSDVVGDPLDIIASGATVYSAKAPEEVVAILRKYGLYGGLEGDMKAVITSKETFNDAALLNTDKTFKHVNNIILGNNMMAIEAASIEALRKKLTPIILRSDVTGDVHNVSLAYTHITSLVCLALEKTLEREEFYDKVKDIPILSLSTSKVDEIYNLIENINGEGMVLIGGGEPTVVVTGSGKGGRNQELALHFSLDWLAKIKSYPKFSEYDVIMLSAGTDGQDGPTDATGAFGYPAIGPMIRDLYLQIKTLATKEVAQAEARKQASAKDEDPPRDLCKTQELSGYLTSKKVDESDSSNTVLQTQLNREDSEDIYQGIHPLILQTMEVERMLPENALKENDTYNLYSRFKNGSDLLKTGLTGTNVMDLHFIYIKKRSCECKINYTPEDKFENSLDGHDLHIDPSTIEKYKKMHAPLTFMTDRFSFKPLFGIDEKVDRLNIKIIDDNLQDPCCRRERKFPTEKLLKDQDFLDCETL